MLPVVEPVYGALRATLVTPLRVAMRWTVDGAHLIPVHGPVILASNHVSYLDPLALGYLADRRHRRVRFLAKRELFDKHVMGAVLRQAHQIPVARDTAEAAGSLDAAVAALAAGECVCVFPEGTISLDLEPMAGKTGTARLAAATAVPHEPAPSTVMLRPLTVTPRRAGVRPPCRDRAPTSRPRRAGAAVDTGPAPGRRSRRWPA